MKLSPAILLVFLLSACSIPAAVPTAVPTEQADAVQTLPASLPDLGEAPELTNEVWLNTDHPLRLAGLRGQVVLLDMWTFG